MALIQCIECGKEISDRAESCPNCGCPKIYQNIESSPISNTCICPYCNELYTEGDDYCDNCGMRITSYNKQNNEKIVEQENIRLENELLEIYKLQLEQEKEEYELQAKCPRCGSTSLSGNKKGFGVGKAVVGAWALGPLGLIAGNKGAKKVIITCLNCGKQFKI